MAEVGPHHLLAGLLADGVAAAILERLGVTEQAVRTSSARLFPAAAPAADGAPPVLSANVVCAVEAAAHHARATARDATCVEVGTEHLLAVVALDAGSRPRRVLVDLGVDIAVVKKELARYIPLNPRRPRRLGRSRPAASCSFCGAPESGSRPLTHGPRVAVCGPCAARAAQALEARAAASADSDG